MWNAGVIITKGNVKLQAFGAGKRMRGLRHGPHRPDLVIGDDLENDENVKSPEQRDKLALAAPHRAFPGRGRRHHGRVRHRHRAALRFRALPPAEGPAVEAISASGPSSNGRTAWTWDAWEELLLNNGEAAALDHYQAHAAEMEAGAVVSWPSAWPLYKLMSQARPRRTRRL